MQEIDNKRKKLTKRESEMTKRKGEKNNESHKVENRKRQMCRFCSDGQSSKGVEIPLIHASAHP